MNYSQQKRANVLSSFADDNGPRAVITATTATTITELKKLNSIHKQHQQLKLKRDRDKNV